MGANEQLASGPASPPDGPVLEAIFGGLQREHDFVPLRVGGRLPADLRGTLYRNGAAVFTAGRNRIGSMVLAPSRPCGSTAPRRSVRYVWCTRRARTATPAAPTTAIAAFCRR